MFGKSFIWSNVEITRHALSHTLSFLSFSHSHSFFVSISLGFSPILSLSLSTSPSFLFPLVSLSLHSFFVSHPPDSLTLFFKPSSFLSLCYSSLLLSLSHFNPLTIALSSPCLSPSLLTVHMSLFPALFLAVFLILSPIFLSLPLPLSLALFHLSL